MNEQLTTLQWVSEWFRTNCDGDWEHENQIVIQTASNPGWLVTIDLSGTDLEGFDKEETHDVSETDWYFYTISDNKFVGSGDLSKLDTILDAFRMVATMIEN